MYGKAVRDAQFLKENGDFVSFLANIAAADLRRLLSVVIFSWIVVSLDRRRALFRSMAHILRKCDQKRIVFL